MARFIGVALAIVIAMVSMAPNAMAQQPKREPTASEIETALALYKEGKQRRERADLNGALEKLRAAYALVETPITALELGRTLALTGKLLEAREILLSVARIPVRKNESQKATEARSESETLATEIKPRLASINIKIQGTLPPASKLTVDGVVVPQEALTSPRVVNPGRHLVVLEADGKTRQAEVTLTEGQTGDASIDAPGATPVVTKPETTSQPTTERSTNPLVYAGFGVAAVGLAVGAITGVVTLSIGSRLDEACRGDSCPPSSKDDVDSAATMGTISTIGFIVAGVGAVVGVIGLLNPSSNGTSPTVTTTARGFAVRF